MGSGEGGDVQSTGAEFVCGLVALSRGLDKGYGGKTVAVQRSSDCNRRI